jgi:hypothetical protein
MIARLTNRLNNGVTMRIRTILAAAAAPAALAAVLLGSSAASASTLPHLTGSVALAGPVQYSTFNNITTPTGPGGGGSFTYTNFNQADTANTGVWAPTGNGGDLQFTTTGGAVYDYTLNAGDTLKALGQTEVQDSASGYWSSPSNPWTISADVNGTAVSYTLNYGSWAAGYQVKATGTIAGDGSASGNWQQTLNRSPSASGTWTLPAGTFQQVLSYTAPVSSVVTNPVVNGQPDPAGMQFSSAVPAGHTYAGTGFTIRVHDGGNPGTNDTYFQDGTNYPVIDGNLTVH